MTRSPAAGLLFLLTFLFGLTGIVLFVRRGVTGSFGVFDLERALVLASWLVAAAGVLLLSGARPRVQVSAPLVAGVVLFTIGALIAAVFELSFLTPEFIASNDWEVVFVSLLLVGGALIGVGLLGSGLVPAWVAWTVIVWNVLGLATRLLVSRENLYMPGLHYVPLLLIGIPLVRCRPRASLRQGVED